MQKTEKLLIRLDPETRRIAEEAAEELGLSIAAYIRMLIRQDNRHKRPADKIA